MTETKLENKFPSVELRLNHTFNNVMKRLMSLNLIYCNILNQGDFGWHDEKKIVIMNNEPFFFN